MLTFNDEIIKCGELHSSPRRMTGRLISNVTYFHGVIGGSEIINQPEAGGISVDCWFNDVSFTDGTTLYEYFATQVDTVSSNGTLVVEKSQSQFGGYERRFSYATLESVEEIALPGQEFPAPFFLSDGTTIAMAVRYNWKLLLAQ